MKVPLIIDGKECCYRCGMEKKSQEIREGWKCSVWGETYKSHLWKVEELTDKQKEGLLSLSKLLETIITLTTES